MKNKVRLFSNGKHSLLLHSDKPCFVILSLIGKTDRLQAFSKDMDVKAGKHLGTGNELCSPLFFNNWTTHPFHCCVSTDLWQRCVGEWEKNCQTSTSSPVNKTKSYAPSICRNREEVQVLSTISTALSLTSASNCEAEHTAVTLQLDTECLISPFIWHRHVISI